MKAGTGNPLELNMALRNSFALVMAGGRGSRLKQLTDNIAKPALPFGGKFRIIDFTLSNCLNSGIRRIGVLTQYKAHHLIQHVQYAWGFLRGEMGEFVQLWPAQQQTSEKTWYLGTANSVYQNLGTLKSYHPEYILILAGDHVYRQDYSIMLAEHIARGSDVTVSCVDVPLESATEFGVVGVDDEYNITSFLEKPSNPPHIPGDPSRAFASMGIYIFNADVLYRELQQNKKLENTSHDFGKDIIPGLVAREDCKLTAHRFHDSANISNHQTEPYWRDVGTVDAFWEANIDLTAVTPSLDLYDRSWPIWTYQVQRPAAKFVFNEDKRRGIAVDSLVSAGCIISGATVERSLIFTDGVLHSYSHVEDSIILPNCDIGRHARLKKVVLGNNCKVPEHLVVGEDPELDAKRFHRTSKGVVLITESMLAKL